MVRLISIILLALIVVGLSACADTQLQSGEESSQDSNGDSSADASADSDGSGWEERDAGDGIPTPPPLPE